MRIVQRLVVAEQESSAQLASTAGAQAFPVFLKVILHP
jgi:hypothetical protein